MKPRILVIAAAGKTGAAVVRQLREQGYPVNALVRTQDRRAETLARAGAKVVTGNLIEPNDLRHAMQGVQRAYVCAPWTLEQLHGAMNFAVSAADARLEVAVAISQRLAQPEHPSVATRQTYLTDRVFGWMPGIDTVTVNTGYGLSSDFNDGHLQYREELGHEFGRPSNRQAVARTSSDNPC